MSIRSSLLILLKSVSLLIFFVCLHYQLDKDTLESSTMLIDCLYSPRVLTDFLLHIRRLCFKFIQVQNYFFLVNWTICDSISSDPPSPLHSYTSSIWLVFTWYMCSFMFRCRFFFSYFSSLGFTGLSESVQWYLFISSGNSQPLFFQTLPVHFYSSLFLLNSIKLTRICFLIFHIS